jgi:transposase-like protein
MTTEEAVFELWENPQPCPACESSDLSVLGTLGNVAWCRCRDCGWDFNLREEVEI